MTFRILTEEELAASADRWEAEEKLEAERVRLRDACVAEHAGHDWELELEHPDEDEHEGGGVQLYCTRCPAGINDVFPDGHDMIWLDIDNEEAVVRDGRHYSPAPLIVPVDVTLHNLSHWNLEYGYEYDVELIVSQRGPARAVEDPS